jgi:hypothetical protein
MGESTREMRSGTEFSSGPNSDRYTDRTQQQIRLQDRRRISGPRSAAARDWNVSDQPGLFKKGREKHPYTPGATHASSLTVMQFSAVVLLSMSRVLFLATFLTAENCITVKDEAWVAPGVYGFTLDGLSVFASGTSPSSNSRVILEVARALAGKD